MESIDVCQFFTGASRKKGKKACPWPKWGGRSTIEIALDGLFPLGLGLASKELGSQDAPVWLETS